MSRYNPGVGMDSRVALIILNYNGLKNLGDILVQ
jgi:hypothetical protein